MAIAYFPLFSSVKTMRSFTSCKVMHHHIFSLPVRAWLDDSFIGRWVGRGGPTELPLRNPDLASCSITSIRRVGWKSNYTNKNKGNFTNWQNTFEVLSGRRNVCQFSGPVLKYGTTGSNWGYRLVPVGPSAVLTLRADCSVTLCIPLFVKFKSILEFLTNISRYKMCPVCNEMCTCWGWTAL